MSTGRAIRTLMILLVLSNAAWIVLSVSQIKRITSLTKQSETLYYENYANDYAATECALKTGFRYNCADGTQRVSCEEGR